MNTENIIETSLSKPEPLIPYYMSMRLVEMYPDKCVLESEDDAFDLQSFAAAYQCILQENADTHSEIWTDWQGDDTGVIRSAANAWYEVRWKEHNLQVITLSWHSANTRVKHYWIMSASRIVSEGFLEAVTTWKNELRDEVLVFASDRTTKDKILCRSLKASTFENVVLPRGMTAEIKNEIGTFFDSEPFYEKHGTPWQRTLTLVGPTGNGKSQTLRAIAGLVDQPVIYVNDIKDGTTQNAQPVRRLFTQARTMAPCLLIVDDFHRVLDARSQELFLYELNSQDNNGILTVLTGNTKACRSLQEAVKMCGRQFTLPRPGQAERRAYITVKNRDVDSEHRLSDSSVEAVVSAFADLSFAQIQEIWLRGAMRMQPDGIARHFEHILLEEAIAYRTEIAPVDFDSKD